MFCICVFSFSGTAALEEDAQILKVIEAYCTSAKTRQTLNSSKKFLNLPHMCTQRGEKLCLQGLLLFSAVYRSLTKKFLTAPSNRIFFFCLSSTSRFLAFLFFGFPLSFVLIFVPPPIFNHIFLSSSHHASVTAFMILRLVADSHTPLHRLVLLFDHHPPPHPTPTFAFTPGCRMQLGRALTWCTTMCWLTWTGPARSRRGAVAACLGQSWALTSRRTLTMTPSGPPTVTGWAQCRGRAASHTRTKEHTEVPQRTLMSCTVCLPL